jgi:hypothetical protein
MNHRNPTLAEVPLDPDCDAYLPKLERTDVRNHIQIWELATQVVNIWHGGS